MKNLKVIGYGLWVIGMLLVSVPTMAQQNQWKTSSMQGSGSAYSSNVTAVGATTIGEMATTTENYSPANAGPRRSFGTNTDQGYQDEGSPVGDAVLPLMAFAMLFGGVIYMRRKRAAKS